MRTTTRSRLLPALFSLVLLAPGLPSLAAQDPPGNAAAGGNPGKQGPRYRGEELLVRFSPLLGKGAKEDAIRRRGFRKIREFPSLDLFHVKTRPNQTVEEARDEFLAEPGVLYAEPNHILTIGLVPDDRRFPEQWGFQNTGQAGGTASADIDAPSAWDLWTGSDNAVVAVIDTGIDYRHGDLAGNMWVNEAERYGLPGVDDDGNGYVDDVHGIDTFHHDADPMDDNQHGTHVAGVIGAVGNNVTGVAGVNWAVRLMACKFLGADGSGSVADAIECLEYVRQMRSRGVNVVATNNSYGMGEHSQALSDAIDAQREILFVAAAGNSSQDVDRTPSYPASYFLPNILSVGATGRDDALAYFSNYGVQTVLVAAPGVDILSTLPGDSYGALSGTSMAAPHLTGLAALAGSYRPGSGWAGVRNRILAGGEDLPSLAGTSVTGRRANAFLALSCENRPLMAPWKYSFTAGVVGTLAALSIDCDSPAGPVTVTASSNETVTLRDDGVLPDLAAGDGIFTAEWTPAAEVTELTFTSPAGTRTVTPPSLADLAVVSVSGPSTAETGETIRLSALIRNAGKQEAGLFVVGFYLSTDPAISSADVSLGSAIVWILGAGSEQTVSVDAAIPAGLASGTYYAGAVADTIGWIEESDESNNTGAGAPFSITRVYPDLVMTSVSGPSSAETGRPITLAGTVMNQGRIKAGPFSVGFYLSTDDRISTKDVYLGSASVPSLGAGAGQTVSFTGTVPSTLSGGTYFVGAVADSTGLVAESDEGNNPLAGNPVAVTRLYPDLVVVSVSGPPSGLTGQTVPVTVTVRNAGTGAAPSAYLNVYLSKDAAITTLDTRIGYVFAPALPAGAEQTITVNGTIPAAQAPGTWYLGAVADAFSSIAEPDESNNALAGNTLQVSGSDLAVLSVSGPTSGLTGQTVPVTVTIRNIGPGAAPSSYLYVYLSKDAVITTLDSRIGYVLAPALAAGAEQTIVVNATIPAAQAPGAWYLGAVADAISQVPEANESNNALAGNPFEVSGSDLAVLSVSGPTSGLTGQAVPVTVTIRNLGPGAAPSSYLYVYLSKDATITTFDTRIGFVLAPALGAGAEQTILVNTTIPAAQAPGAWYLGAVADGISQVPEANESNNALAGSTLEVSGSDLAVLSVSGPASGLAGQPVPVTVTVRNLGPGAAPSSYLYVYLSKDATITTLDTRIGFVLAPALAAGAEQTIVVNATIPAAQASGAWYLGAIADGIFQIPEPSESNNTLAGNTLVVGAGP